jgi:hypothetical protein
MLSLARYTLSDPTTDALAQRLRVVLDDHVPGKETRAARPDSDRWNNWVFEVGGAANLALEQRTRRLGFSGNVEARRVTERWKTSVAATGAIRTSRYAFSDGSEVAFHQRSYGFRAGSSGP